ncbi:MAG: LOG family protein [Bacilli bacterium]|nr:LOG family protein [Bacilli bacterium]
MKIFISCSSSEEINDEYKIVTKYLTEELAKKNELVFGCANRGLMGICYNSFKNNNRKVIGVCYEMYKDELNSLELDEVHMVKSLEESNRLLGELSDVILLLPGSYGTLSEFICLLEEKRTGIHNKEIIMFNINGFYNDLINMFNKIYNNVSNKYDFNNLCKVFNTSDEIIEYIKKSY